VRGERVDQQSAAYIKDPDTPVRFVGKGKDKRWVGMASVAFANSMTCLRVELMKYLGDKSGDCGENDHSQPISRRPTDATQPTRRDGVVIDTARRLTSRRSASVTSGTVKNLVNTSSSM